ncbi:MAG: HigA family addiction module antitoxin [Candidatus Mucispirillum faecigallinarum]|nr:HigA family addiction module antitoxin [Candidatus Mucispirillum faecigallinarum]
MLIEEFIHILGIFACKKAEYINMPASRIQDILKDKHKITVDTSLRLVRYFYVNDKYILNLQNDIDIRSV